MAQYNLIFQGKIIDGASLDEVKNNISRLFKTDAAKTDVLFSGKAIVIKKNLNTESAKKYLAIIKKAGAVVKAVKIETIEKSPPPSPESSSETVPAAKSTNLSAGLASLINYNSSIPQAATSDSDTSAAETAVHKKVESCEDKNTDEESNLKLAPTGSNILISTNKQNQIEVPDTSYLSMSEAETGSLEEFAQTLEAVELPNIDKLTMGDANSGSLEEFAITVAPAVLPDISNLNVAAQDDTPLSDQSPEKTPVELPDTSDLSMSDAQKGTLEGVGIKPEPAEIPDTSHLEIEKAKEAETITGKAVFQID